jgi:glutamate-ammonia-ligase adenylyltransferase
MHPWRIDFPTSRPLREILDRALGLLAQSEPACAALEAAPAVVRESLTRVFACSDFVAQSCARDPRLLPELLVQGDLTKRRTPEDFTGWGPAGPSAGSLADEAELLAVLRRWRRREMVRIAWRDLAGWADLTETLADTSGFAESALNLAAAHARQSLAVRHGEARYPTGEIQPLVIVGMGKLGGAELNFSSDVDLVLLFPEHGETDGARPITHEELFTRMAQRLIRLLSTPTPDGIVMRIDMRLRPFGDSGPLVPSFAFLEDYLPRHGRDWERYAYVKARPISARDTYLQIEEAAVRPFVYRRYLDYGMLESLREMKALIARAVAQADVADDVKLGAGGIREVEMIVQLFQLIRGGRDARLRTPSLLSALKLLGSARLLPNDAVGQLEAAYGHLRRLENRLQMLADTQAHRLPQDPVARERIALAMGERDWASLMQRHDAHRARVMEHFDQVLGSRRPSSGPQALASLWETEASRAELAPVLASIGFTDSEEVARLLLALRSGVLVRKLDEPGQKRLQSLIPPLMHEIAKQPDAMSALRRVLRVIEAIGQRSAYFALLTENKWARQRLVELCACGDFLADQIAAYPLLLDELIDERLLEELPDRESLTQELELHRHPQPDPEHQVEGLCQVQRAAVFRVGVADLIGRLPLMRVSDRLTLIAEVIVQRVIELAWEQITRQFGTPMCDEGGANRPVSICAVGYGKLGGQELGYASDLDLVFLHDSAGEQQETTRSIDNQVFFVRLVQRIVHLLTVHSAAGRLYEVDMRLRPSGKGGLLVTSIHAFAEYQKRDAWTWEHQSLLHARSVAGAKPLRQEFESVRMDVLCNHVRRASLREDVRSMRERMRKERSRARSGQLDLKQDAGGIADIEFLAQYWALRWAGEYPPVAMFSDTIRQLESVASADLVPQGTVDVLTHAYRQYRARAHHLSLAGAQPILPIGEFSEERASVTRIWDETMADGT